MNREGEKGEEERERERESPILPQHIINKNHSRFLVEGLSVGGVVPPVPSHPHNIASSSVRLCWSSKRMRVVRRFGSVGESVIITMEPAVEST